MYNYKETYELMRKFYEIGVNEVRIMDYLMQRDVAEITYCELTEALGLDKEKMVSNIRKALLHLQELGFVYIVNEHCEDERKTKTYNPMKACYIVDGWMEKLLAN